jgi:hypothetical protein
MLITMGDIHILGGIPSIMIGKAINILIGGIPSILVRETLSIPMGEIASILDKRPTNLSGCRFAPICQVK